MVVSYFHHCNKILQLSDLLTFDLAEFELILSDTQSIIKIIVLTPQRVQETQLVQREDQKESYPTRQKEQKKKTFKTGQQLHK